MEGVAGGTIDGFFFVNFIIRIASKTITIIAMMRATRLCTIIEIMIVTIERTSAIKKVAMPIKERLIVPAIGRMSKRTLTGPSSMARPSHIRIKPRRRSSHTELVYSECMEAIAASLDSANAR